MKFGLNKKMGGGGGGGGFYLSLKGLKFFFLKVLKPFYLLIFY